MTAVALPPQLIDAHHHLWSYSEAEYPWISSQMQILRRDYLPDDLSLIAKEAGVTGTVAVQARQTTAETEWLAGLAAESSLIRGVVGWAPLIDPAVGGYLERCAGNAKICGMRHVLHDEPDDDYMLRADFNAGIAMLRQFNLRYDILIFARHLRQTIEFVDRHPRQTFILDHIAKPAIRQGEDTFWRSHLMKLARRENLYCKLSGMVTEADWGRWTPADLAPYFETVLEAFGPSRLMFGSDWPVQALACGYGKWIEIVKDSIRQLSPGEQQRVLAGTAIEAYGLPNGS